MKTIEEAAKEAIPYLKGVITTLENAKKLFIKGAKYQKEADSRVMYTEEEVYNIFIKWFNYTTEGIIDFEDWFEQNKKK
jgi:hypothetical protein